MTQQRSHGVISFRDVGMEYQARGGSVEAVRNITFDVDPGAFVSLVGASGCGKSTILKIAAGLIPGHTGSAEVDGSPARPGRRDIGIMLQSPVLFPWRTVLQNILLPAEVFELDISSATIRASELIELVGLEGFADKYPWELSGGMQQRASLARLLVADPTTLLLDEPFAALDEFTRERLNLELAAIHESLTTRSALYVTHNIREAVLLSDFVVVLKPRPGEIIDIVNVDLPRPRTRELIESPRTAELEGGIRRMLYQASSGQDEL